MPAVQDFVIIKLQIAKCGIVASDVIHANRSFSRVPPDIGVIRMNLDAAIFEHQLGKAQPPVPLTAVPRHVTAERLSCQVLQQSSSLFGAVRADVSLDSPQQVHSNRIPQRCCVRRQVLQAYCLACPSLRKSFNGYSSRLMLAQTASHSCSLPFHGLASNARLQERLLRFKENTQLQHVMCWSPNLQPRSPTQCMILLFIAL